MSDFTGEFEFWRDRDIFVTGHTGFKGSWLCIWLSMMGARVHGMALAPTDEGVFNSTCVKDVLTSSTIGDIRDVSAVQGALAASNAQVVVHMAAQSLVKASFDDPLTTYNTNVMGTANVLDAVRRQPGVGAVVVVTSDKCYENQEWAWGYRENEPMGGYDPYSSSKGCAELVTSSFRQSYFGGASTCRIASARAGNVIGGGDYACDRLIPDLIRSAREGKKTIIRNPRAIRPWQHVLEPLSGYLSLARFLLGRDGNSYEEGWNFGPAQSSERTVKDVVEAICSAYGDSGSWEVYQGRQVHEATFLKLDSSKARLRLGWHPKWDFDKAVAETVAWYRAEAAGDDMYAFTTQQILAYTSVRAMNIGKGND